MMFGRAIGIYPQISPISADSFPIPISENLRNLWIDLFRSRVRTRQWFFSAADSVLSTDYADSRRFLAYTNL
jgi:hypothetical protein